MSMELTMLAVSIPLGAALVVGAVPRSEPALARALGLVGALVELGVILAMVLGFDPAGASVQREVVVPWLPAYGVAFSLGVDGEVLAVLLVLGLVFPLALMVGGRPRAGEPPLVVGMLVLQAAWVAVVLARDLVTLAGCWELATIVAVILVGERGDGRMGVAGRTAAARRYAAHVLPGAAALIAVVILLGVSHSHANSGLWSWRLDDIALVTLPEDAQMLGFALVVLALATVLPLVPLQGALAPVCVSGPTPVVAALLGAGMPMAVFLLERLGMSFFPLAAGEWAEPLAAVAMVGAIYAALACWAEREPGRLLAHVALVHLSLAIVAAVSGSATARGGLGLHLIAHGLGLTVLTAVLHSLRRDGVASLGELAGWAAVAPRAWSAALAGSLVLIGVPGTAGFVGGLSIVVGVSLEGGLELAHPTTWSVLTFVASSLGALGLLRSFWYAGRGTLHPGPRPRVSELDLRESVVAGVAVALALVVGLAPSPLLTRSDAATRGAVDDFHLARCLAIEARTHPRPHVREEFGPVCLDPITRIRQVYDRGGGEGGDHHDHEEASP